MVLNECSLNSDDFYSPMCVSGYLTPLQRKKLREKRNTPLASVFDTDFKTPKSSKAIKKPKRQSSAKPKVKTPKEQPCPKPSKENLQELRCSVSVLVAQGTNDDLKKERRFFKNRSPQHLQKTEFVMPLTYKKRRLDFSDEKRKLAMSERIEKRSMVNSTNVKPKLTKETLIESMENIPAAVTPRQNVSARKEPSVLVRNGAEVTPILEKMIPKESVRRQPMGIIPVNKNNSIVETPTRKVNACEEQLALDDEQHVEELCTPKTELSISGNIFDFAWPSDEELLKRQNVARAELKRAIWARNDALAKEAGIAASSDSKNESLDDVETEGKASLPKLYSIFNNLKARTTESKIKGSVQKKSPHGMRDTSKGEEQMIIDAGQKEIGSRLCKTCNMLYTIGHEEDEKLHSGYHHTFLINLRFPGWKKECIVGDFDDGRVIKIVDTDKNFKLKKVQDILYIANRDLGFPSAGFPMRPNIMFFLFISNDKRVGGCLVAEAIESACPVVMEERTDTVSNSDKKPIWKLGNWYASTEPVKAICGINRIWVAMEFRCRKVASRLVDCLRGSFIYGHVVDCREMAFTDPSPDGREFAASYTGTDNFLVYK